MLRTFSKKKMPGDRKVRWSMFAGTSGSEGTPKEQNETPQTVAPLPNSTTLTPVIPPAPPRSPSTLALRPAALRKMDEDEHSHDLNAAGDNFNDLREYNAGGQPSSSTSKAREVKSPGDKKFRSTNHKTVAPKSVAAQVAKQPTRETDNLTDCGALLDNFLEELLVEQKYDVERRNSNTAPPTELRNQFRDRNIKDLIDLLYLIVKQLERTHDVEYTRSARILRNIIAPAMAADLSAADRAQIIANNKSLRLIKNVSLAVYSSLHIADVVFRRSRLSLSAMLSLPSSTGRL
jgi:hypothetical protein